MKNPKCRYDERQIKERADAFTMGMLIAVVLTGVFYTLATFTSLALPLKEVLATLICVTFAATMTRLIVRDAYDRMYETTGWILFALVGILGMGSLILTVSERATGNLDSLAAFLSRLFNSVCMLTPPITYLVRRLWNRRYKES